MRWWNPLSIFSSFSSLDWWDLTYAGQAPARLVKKAETECQVGAASLLTLEGWTLEGITTMYLKLLDSPFHMVRNACWGCTLFSGAGEPDSDYQKELWFSSSMADLRHGASFYILFLKACLFKPIFTPTSRFSILTLKSVLKWDIETYLLLKYWKNLNLFSVFSLF